MTEAEVIREMIVGVIVFSVCTLAFGGMGLLSVLRPDIVDSPLDGWWGRYTKSSPEDKPKRLATYRKSGILNLLVAALLLFITISRLNELLAKIL